MACDDVTTINDVWVLAVALGGFALLLAILFVGISYLVRLTDV